MHCSASCCLLRVGTNYLSSWHLYLLHRSPWESPSAPAHIRENDAPQTDIWSSRKTNELLTCARKQTELLPWAHKTISPSSACTEGASAPHAFASCTTIFHRLCSVRLRTNCFHRMNLQVEAMWKFDSCSLESFWNIDARIKEKGKFSHFKSSWYPHLQVYSNSCKSLSSTCSERWILRQKQASFTTFKTLAFAGFEKTPTLVH